MCTLLNRRLMKLICAIGLFCFPAFAFSQVSIGNWNFNNTLNATGGANNTASAAALSPSVPVGAYNGGTVYFGEGGWPTGTTIDTNMYLEFTLTPNTGYTLNISSLDLSIRRSTTGTPAGSGPRAWALRSSLDGFATNITAQTLTTSASTISVSLGGSYVNLNSAITFRLYGYDVFNTSGGLNRFVFENITARGLSLLPVSISNLSGSIQNNMAHLQCTISEIESLQKLELERSTNGNHFETVAASVSTQNGLSTFSDSRLPNNASKLYYRVKATQPNGSILYSNILTLNKQQEAGFKFNSISTSGSQVIAQINADASGAAKLMISTTDGKTIYQQAIMLSKGSQVYTINSKQPAGINIMSVVQNGIIVSRQFVNY